MNDLLKSYIEQIDKINENLTALLSNDEKNKQIISDLKGYSSKLKEAIKSKTSSSEELIETDISIPGPTSALAGSKVSLSYSQMLNIYDYMNESIKSISASYENIQGVYNSRDSWQGSAGTRYFDRLKTDISPINETVLDKSKLPLTVSVISKMVEENKATDKQIIDIDILKASIESIIGAATSINVGHTVNTELNDSVKTNSNIQGNSIITDAYSVNEELNNSVGVNGNIQGNSITTDAYSVNEELNNSVGINGNIQGNSVVTDAYAVNEELNNSVGVNGNVAEVLSKSSYFDSRDLPELNTDFMFNTPTTTSVNIDNSMDSAINDVKTN